jgi:phosphoribosylaminoimidazole-succinocarboxamide synthase
MIDSDNEIICLWFELIKTQAILQHYINFSQVDENVIKQAQIIALEACQRRFPLSGVKLK